MVLALLPVDLVLVVFDHILVFEGSVGVAGDVKGPRVWLRLGHHCIEGLPGANLGKRANHAYILSSGEVFVNVEGYGDLIVIVLFMLKFLKWAKIEI